MTPIDLIDYTRSSKKIPNVLLKPNERIQPPPSSWKILAGYCIDFSIIISASYAISTLFQFAFSNLMVTRSLHNAFREIPYDSLTSTMLPFMFLSYFFFSYLFNHGQSMGMKMMKTRIEMPEMSFRSSFLWGMFSSAVFMTAGLSFVLSYKWMQQKGWGEVKGHDHLYHVLMTPVSLSPVNLLELSMANSVTPIEEETEVSYLEAA